MYLLLIKQAFHVLNETFAVSCEGRCTRFWNMKYLLIQRWLTDEHWSCQSHSSKVEKELWLEEKWVLPLVSSMKANITAMKGSPLWSSLQKDCHQSLSRWKLTREFTALEIHAREKKTGTLFARFWYDSSRKGHVENTGSAGISSHRVIYQLDTE